VPQIEVSFDIDANGIVHVGAKDRGTGKEQSITVTGGSALSKSDIERMVKDAEEHAAEDQQRREEADTRNRAEQFAYQTEKVLDDSADKVPSELADEVKEAIAAVKKALEGDDTDAVKAAHDDLVAKAQKIGDAIYAKQAEGDSPSSSDDASSSDEDVVDAEIVDEDESK
jgi:molecular chaperone DnaK